MDVCVHALVDITYLTLYTLQANDILLYTQQAKKLAEGVITIRTECIANVLPTKCMLQMQASGGGSKSLRLIAFSHFFRFSLSTGIL